MRDGISAFLLSQAGRRHACFHCCLRYNRLYFRGERPLKSYCIDLHLRCFIQQGGSLHTEPALHPILSAPRPCISLVTDSGLNGSFSVRRLARLGKALKSTRRILTRLTKALAHSA